MLLQAKLLITVAAFRSPTLTSYAGSGIKRLNKSAAYGSPGLYIMKRQPSKTAKP